MQFISEESVEIEVRNLPLWQANLSLIGLIGILAGIAGLVRARLENARESIETARQLMPRPEVEQVEGAQIGVIAFGTSHWAALECRDQLAADAGVRTSYLRLKAFPFTDDLAAFIDAHDRVYVVEQNRDAQMLGLMRMELSAARIAKLRSVTRVKS